MKASFRRCQNCPHLDRSDWCSKLRDRPAQPHRRIILVVIGLFLLRKRTQRPHVACTIRSLLFARILLDLATSRRTCFLGRLDFGMVVHGSCVMVENILRQR